MSSNFVNRGKALYLIAERIRKLRHGLEADEKHFVSFYGVSSIGKTTLLENLQGYYTTPQNDCIHPKSKETFNSSVKPCGEKHEPIPCALVDFSTGKFNDPQQGYVNVLEEIILNVRNVAPQKEVSKFFRETGEFRKILKQSASGYGNEFIVAAKAANITEQFSNVMKGLIEHHKAILILLDSVELIHPEVMDLIESEIFKEFKSKRGFLVILAGITRHRWKNFGSALAQYSTWYELMSFDILHTQAQIDPRLADISVKIYELTGGHPGANHHVAQMLQKEDFQNTQPSFWVERNKRRISKSIVQEVVLKGIVDENITEAFFKMSIVRQFEMSLLSKLLQHDYPPRFINSVEVFFFWELLRKMESTGLLKMVRETRIWTIDPAVRHILTAFLKLNYPETYQKLHQIAFTTYNDWIIKHPDDRHFFAVECLFHHARLWIFDNPDVRTEILVTNLIELLHKFLSLPGIDRLSLKESIETDSDLREMLGDKLEKLVRII